MLQHTYQILIDGNSVHSAIEFHKFIRRKLRFPDYYGMNADAFWDCLQDTLLSDCDVNLVWKSYEKSAIAFGKDAEVFRTILFDAQEKYPSNMKVTIEY